MTDMSLSLVYPPTCRWHTADGRCGDPDGHPYPCGFRCARHSPAALAGRDEPPTTALRKEEL